MNEKIYNITNNLLDSLFDDADKGICSNLTYKNQSETLPDDYTFDFSEFEDLLNKTFPRFNKIKINPNIQTNTSIKKKPLIINFIGEPGAGKSWASWYISAKLKQNGFKVEYLPEFAKSKLYEHSEKVFTCEPYIFGKQLYKMHSMSDEVDIIVDNVWVWSFDEEVLPMLYIDELNQPIANIYVKDYIWDDYKDEIETLKFSDRLVFNVAQANVLNPIKEIYYYVSNEKNVLSKKQLDSIVDWNKFDEIVELTDEGFYVVYAKITDSDGNVIYINTDLLVVDLTGSEIIISSSFFDNTWTEFKTDLNNYYVNQQVSIDVKAEDSLSGINKIYYYLSDTVISRDDIEQVDEWNEYVEPILISDSKTIVYVKVLDNCDYITYANSDLIIMNGYVLKTISPGMNGSSNDNLYISGNSSVLLNFVYSDTNEYVEGSKHQLISNVLLPVNTKITLIDTSDTIVKCIDSYNCFVRIYTLPLQSFVCLSTLKLILPSHVL